MSLTKFVATEPLTLLLKFNGGISPTVMTYIQRWLMSKITMKGIGKEMTRYSNNFQQRIEVFGGVRVILHMVNRVLSK